MNYQALVYFSLILTTTIRASDHLALFLIYTEVQIHTNIRTKDESYEFEEQIWNLFLHMILPGVFRGLPETVKVRTWCGSPHPPNNALPSTSHSWCTKRKTRSEKSSDWPTTPHFVSATVRAWTEFWLQSSAPFSHINLSTCSSIRTWFSCCYLFSQFRSHFT